MARRPGFPRANARVAVFTVKGDLHALLLRKRLIDDFGICCHIVETEELSLAGDFSWTGEGAWLLDSEGNGSIQQGSTSSGGGVATVSGGTEGTRRKTGSCLGVRPTPSMDWHGPASAGFF